MSSFTIGYAHNYDHQNTLDILFQHAQSAIAYAEDDKVFLHPDKVHFHEGGVFVQGEWGQVIAIPCIYSNEFEPSLTGNPRSQMRTIWICANHNCQKKILP